MLLICTCTGKPQRKNEVWGEWGNIRSNKKARACVPGCVITGGRASFVLRVMPLGEICKWSLASGRVSFALQTKCRGRRVDQRTRVLYVQGQHMQLFIQCSFNTQRVCDAVRDRTIAIICARITNCEAPRFIAEQRCQKTYPLRM